MQTNLGAIEQDPELPSDSGKLHSGQKFKLCLHWCFPHVYGCSEEKHFINFSNWFCEAKMPKQFLFSQMRVFFNDYVMIILISI